MIINLTQHPASAEQVLAGVVDLPAGQRAMLIDALTVEKLPTAQEIAERCANIAVLAVHNSLGGDDNDDPHPIQAMIGGAPWMMARLEAALLDQGVEPVYAFSVRESTETTAPDGSTHKINVFRHGGFVPTK